MDSYELVITPDAEDDLKDIKEYLLSIYSASSTAKKYIHEIKERILSLSTMPSRFILVEDEPWHSRGIRKTLVNDYFVYYRVVEERNEVSIMNVVYARRDQLLALKHMKTG